ncbi:MAG: zinc ABC transporter substrate-binding protein, partial [Erysipelotrichaceae bacterium]|nr:zinc ABC transporter substrate-binding protein [Erysipelotrichaceae bacterium]
IWMDPISMSSMALTIKEWLQQRYPEESLVFENNFKAIQAELVRMDAEYRQLLNYSNIKMVTVAPTFGCWQKVYGVQVYPLIMSRFGVLPTEEQLEVIKKQIVADGVKYIVYDPTLPEDMQALYQQVRDELKLKEITLSSLSILSEADKEKSKDYKTIMYENLTALENAFK